MKVLDLRCEHGHTFEGWFGSEEDYRAQQAQRRIECPMCGSAEVNKTLSAPRLNLGAPAEMAASVPAKAESPSIPPRLQAAWLAMARHVMAHADDVGTRFAEEARRMHHGEAEERAIRGQATPEETVSLRQEGIPVLSLPLPAALEGPVH